MSNKPDSTAAEQFLEKYETPSPSDWLTQKRSVVATLMTEFATIEAAKEAQRFAEWIANSDYEWSHRAVNPRLWTRGLDEDLSFTTEELYQLYQEGKG